MVPSPLFLSPSDDLHGPPFQRSSASAIEYMDSYKENKKCKDGAKIQFSAVFALCAKRAQGCLCKLRLAPFIECRVLRCAASKTTLILTQQYFIQQATMLMKFLFTNPNPNCNPNLNPNSINLLVTLAIKLNQIIHSWNNFI
jgi:hypothetical protein